MTRDEIVTLLLARLERREDDTYLQGMIPLEMKLVQESLERRPALPWFLETEESSSATVNGEDRLLEPSDFLLMDDEQGLFILPATSTTQYKRLRKRSFNDMHKRYADRSGLPEAFSHDGTNFRLRPIPDAAYPVKMVYYAKDTWPAGNETNKWMTIAPKVILNETGVVMAGEYLHNMTLREQFRTDADKAWADLWMLHETRVIIGRDVTMGEPR